MGRGRKKVKLTEEQQSFIRKNYKLLTQRTMCIHLHLGYKTIQRWMVDNRLVPAEDTLEDNKKAPDIGIGKLFNYKAYENWLI